MKWQKINDSHYKCGDWTISVAVNVPLPFGLWFQQKNLGYFETLERAQSAYMDQIAWQE